MANVLITGGSGLLALNWALRARESHNVTLGLHSIFAEIEGVESLFFDYKNLDVFTEQLRDGRYDVVIHTAGYTNVDDCENNPSIAKAVNEDISELVAISTNFLKIKMVHISTDHLFSGSSAFVKEDCKPSPLNVYAMTKLNAEQVVLKGNPEALIVRTNFFGWGASKKPSFSDWIYYSLSSHKKITLFNDVFFTPILIETLVDSVDCLLGCNQKGIFNVVSSERISKYDFGLMLSNVFGLDRNTLNVGSIEVGEKRVLRPKDMSLSNHKLLGILKKCGKESFPPSLLEQLEMLKMQLECGKYDEIRQAIREI